MAQTVTVSSGDTLTGILRKKRGLDESESHSWLRRMRTANPHISNLNRLYPGDRVLVPESLTETVSSEKIWQSALWARVKIISHFIHPCFRLSLPDLQPQNPQNSLLFLRF